MDGSALGHKMEQDLLYVVPKHGKVNLKYNQEIEHACLRGWIHIANIPAKMTIYN